MEEGPFKKKVRCVSQWHMFILENIDKNKQKKYYTYSHTLKTVSNICVHILNAW